MSSDSLAQGLTDTAQVFEGIGRVMLRKVPRIPIGKRMSHVNGSYPLTWTAKTPHLASTFYIGCSASTVH